MTIRDTTYLGEPALTMESVNLTAVFIPGSGGKLASLKHSSSDYELMYQNPRWGVSLRGYDAVYDQSATGMDELFPMTAGAAYPEEPWEGISCPDKGEVWNQPMKTISIDGCLEQEVRGVRFPYFLKRKVSLSGETIRFSYTLENPVPYAFKATWAVQPHMNLSKGSTLNVKGTADLLVDFSFNDRINDPTLTHSWPIAQGQGNAVDFSAPMVLDGGADKLYLNDCSEKQVELNNPESGLKTLFDFNDPRIPACGIWLDRGAWPADTPDNLIAVGPSIGISDVFSRSLEKGVFLEVPGESSVFWEWSMTVSPM